MMELLLSGNFWFGVASGIALTIIVLYVLVRVIDKSTSNQRG